MYTSFASLRYNSYSQKSLAFKAWCREVICPDNNYVSHRNDTSFIRDGSEFWKNTANYLVEKYKNEDKVNIIEYGCSDGSESYTLAMALLSSGKNNQKFFPILAKDFDEIAINKAKSNDFETFDEEIWGLENLTNGNVNRYMYLLEEPNKLLHLRPKNSLKSHVQFSKANILNDYINIPSKNSVVLARNFWGYLDKDAYKLADSLGKQMGSGSVLIIGKHDLDCCLLNNGINLDKVLQQKGFKRTENKFIYEKCYSHIPVINYAQRFFASDI